MKLHKILLLASLVASFAYADEQGPSHKLLENPVSDGDIIFRVNDGGVKTDPFRIVGATSTVSLLNPLGANFGGSGVANNAAATTTRSGNFGLTLTLTALTSVTLPTSGTLASLAGNEVFSNKTISGASNTITNVSLTTGVTGVLPLANGGSNKNMTAVNGGIVYTDADSQEVSAAGTSGQYLKSAGAGTPTWSAVDLASASVTGVLPIANGGSNKALTLSAGGIPYFDADSFEVLAAGTTSQWLCSGGSGAPTWCDTTTRSKSIQQGSGVGLTVGADNGAQTLTNSTRKIGRISAPHYTNTEEPLALILGDSDGSAGTPTTSLVSIGGGSATMNTATQLNFYTAADTVTTTGTLRLGIDSSGHANFGSGAANAHLDAIGDEDSPTYSWVGDDNTGMWNSAANEIGFTTGAGFRMRITTAGAEIFGGVNISDFVGSGGIDGNRSNGTRLAPTVVNSGETLTQFRGFGWSTAALALRNATTIRSVVDGAPDTAGDTTDMPGRLEFLTSADGTSSPSVRMAISNAGEVKFSTAAGNPQINPNSSDPTLPGYTFIGDTDTGMATPNSNELTLSTAGEPHVFVTTQLIGANYGGSADLVLRRNNGTFAVPTVSTDGEIAGLVEFRGYNTSLAGFDDLAEIRGIVDGEPNTAGDSTDMPGRLEFQTSPDGTGTPTTRMSIDNLGSVGIGAHGTGQPAFYTILTTPASTVSCTAMCNTGEPSGLDNSSGVAIGCWISTTGVPLAIGDITSQARSALCLAVRD